MTVTGLSIPMTVNKGGGAKIENSDAQLHKLILQALQEGDDDNPFQDLGIQPKIETADGTHENTTSWYRPRPRV